MNRDAETYIGDGVYARFDGYSIILRAPREFGDHWIGLEPPMIRLLVEFAEKSLREAVAKRVAASPTVDPADILRAAGLHEEAPTADGTRVFSFGDDK